MKRGECRQLDSGVETEQIAGSACVLLRELGHLRAASRTGRTKHVAALGSLLHRGLIVRNGLLLLTLYTKHFSQ